MGLFGKKKKIEELEIISQIKSDRIRELEELCEVKDAYFSEMMSDGLRNGSSLAGKHMANRKKYLKNKK